MKNTAGVCQAVGVRKELNVKTPFQVVEKWFMLKPEIFE